MALLCCKLFRFFYIHFRPLPRGTLTLTHIGNAPNQSSLSFLSRVCTVQYCTVYWIFIRRVVSNGIITLFRFASFHHLAVCRNVWIHYCDRAAGDALYTHSIDCRVDYRLKVRIGIGTGTVQCGVWRIEDCVAIDDTYYTVAR